MTSIYSSNILIVSSESLSNIKNEFKFVALQKFYDISVKFLQVLIIIMSL